MKDVEIAIHWCNSHLEKKESDYNVWGGNRIHLTLINKDTKKTDHHEIELSDEVIKGLIPLLEKELIPEMENKVSDIEIQINQLLDSKEKSNSENRNLNKKIIHGKRIITIIDTPRNESTANGFLP